MLHSKRGLPLTETQPPMTRANLGQSAEPLVLLPPIPRILSSRNSCDFEVEIEKIACLINLIQEPFVVELVEFVQGLVDW